MVFTGVNQSSDWVQTQSVVKKYVDEGLTVQVRRQDFGQASREHDRYEYEVYVQFPEGGRKNG